MSRYKFILDDAEGAVEMMVHMLEDLRVAELRRAAHALHRDRADTSVGYAHHRAMVSRLDGQVRRRLHDLRTVAERTARMLVEGFDLDGGAVPGEGSD
jgi:molybdopterin-guanine dinucleotide biosynthesis protein